MEENKKVVYAELWGDRVTLKELLIAAVIGIVLTMGCYLAASSYFLNNPDIEPGLAKGYSLMVGIGGCILSAAISSRLFQPKRIIVDKAEAADVAGALEAAGSTMEAEIEGIRNASPESVREMERLGLTGLLDLRNAAEIETKKETGKGAEEGVQQETGKKAERAGKGAERL